METLRRAFVDRKHNHGDNQAVDWSSFDNCSSNGSTKGKSNSSGLARGDTFASRFHLKRNAAHMHHNSGGSQPSQTGRASLDKSRNRESMTSRNDSASSDRGQSPVSHFNTSYIPSEADTSVLSNASPAVKTQSTDRQDAINDPMHSSNHETHDSASDEKPQIQQNISLQESAERKSSLDKEAREEALVLSWSKKNKEARLDLLAESAAESYMDRFTEVSDLERQNCSSTATIFTPDVTTHSIQIRMARANERTSDCISAEVKRAMAKMAASSTTEPDQPPPNQFSPGSPGSPMSHPRSQSLSHEEGQPQALITHVLPGDYSSMGAAATATVFRNPNYQTTEQTLYAGLGFGLDLASRIPRRPSGHRSSINDTPQLGAANGDHIVRSKSVLSRQFPCHSSSPVPYQGPDLAIVESTPPSGRNSSDTQRNHGKVSLTGRKSLDPTSLGEGDVNNTERKGGDMERSVTRTTRGTQNSQSTDHGSPDSLPENGQASERAGAVARSMKSWGNRLRKYASYQSVSHHQPLDVSSLDVHEKSDEHDKEVTAYLMPLLTLPSSTLQLSLPSPYLFKNRENVHQSSSENQSPRKFPMENAVTTRPTPSGVDTNKPISDESPYLAADFTWRRAELVDSLSRSQTSGRMCSVNSGSAHGVQPGAIPNSQVSAQSSADHDLATFGPNNSTSPRDGKENNSPDAEASPLQPEEGWEQVSVNVSPSKPTFFPHYSLHASDSQDCESPTTIYNDSEANTGSAHPMSPSTTSSIRSKATIPTSPNDDGQASDDLLSSNDSELSYHSARQDVNAIQSEDHQELPSLSIHDKDSVDAVSVSSNPERKTLSGQDETSVCHSRHSEPSIKEYYCREPCETPSSSTENRQLGKNAQNETPDTVASPRPSSTHDEVFVANQVGESQREQAQMPFSGSHASTTHPPPEPQVSLPLSTYQHAPFILAYNSKVLAEQFTIIEVAALAEIDWRDLVDMNWSNDQNTLDWAGYLTSAERRGIDVVIARFNLMVKWIVSEIVLTHDISERAGAISKFIHIAIQARRMRNFSTMVQVTIALSSVDCVSLKNTWALVDSDSRHALEEMEVLVQPLRNFKDLRMEMESQGLHEGCVPFVGLYVQDLTYNAQKPPTIHVEGGAQPLVNLERYRTAASIIKSLLRLIDASTRYGFTPVNGVIERCLWISCLKDEDIRLLSKSAEL
ncbi:hypothetical protein KEM56_000932 [Ascosphaera pollenicola]|nr:hypothetical protein KEM56_000932 [Ascosphaera pollenicola]